MTRLRYRTDHCSLADMGPPLDEGLNSTASGIRTSPDPTIVGQLHAMFSATPKVNRTNLKVEASAAGLTLLGSVWP